MLWLCISVISQTVILQNFLLTIAVRHFFNSSHLLYGCPSVYLWWICISFYASWWGTRNVCVCFHTSCRNLGHNLVWILRMVERVSTWIWIQSVLCMHYVKLQQNTQRLPVHVFERGQNYFDATEIPPQKWGHSTPNIGSCIVTKQLDGSRYHLVRG